MPDKPDYYELLGVNRDVNDDEIKKSFRRLAMKYHPDRNPDKGAEEKFKQIKEAYEVLSDKQKRSAYDRFGHSGVNSGSSGFSGGQSGFGGGSGGFEDIGDIFSNFGDVGDIFSNIFGGEKRGRYSGSSYQRSVRGNDLEYELHITLEQSAKGGEIEIQIPIMSVCEACGGTGAKAGSKPMKCKTCGGSGNVFFQRGFFSVQQTCPDCGGTGETVSNPCSTCRRSGRVQKQRKLSVRIPVGIDDGNRLRLTGEGEAGMYGGPPGDLYILIRINKHEIFIRESNDLLCDIPIDFSTAVLGGEIDVPTLNGKSRLRVPEGTQNGSNLRIKNAGIKKLNGSYTGDIVYKIFVEIPVNLSCEQKELLKRFSESIVQNNTSHNPKSKSWFDKVKEFLR